MRTCPGTGVALRKLPRTGVAGFLVGLGGLDPAGRGLALALQLHVHVRQLDERLRRLVPCGGRATCIHQVPSAAPAWGAVPRVGWVVSQRGHTRCLN